MSSIRGRLWLGLVSLAAAAVLGAAGCGSDDDGDNGGAEPAATTEEQPQTAAPDEEPPASADDPEAAFRQFQAALAEGDAGTACGLLAESAVRQTEEASIGGSCEDWVEELAGVFTDEIRAELRDVDVSDVRERGDSATVQYRSPTLGIPLEAELERGAEGWRISRLAEGV